MNNSIVVAHKSGKFAILSGVNDNESEWVEINQNEFQHLHFDNITLEICSKASGYRYIYKISDCKDLCMQLRNIDLDIEYTDIILLEHLFSDLAEWDDVEVIVESDYTRKFSIEINGDKLNFILSKLPLMNRCRYTLSIYVV